MREMVKIGLWSDSVNFPNIPLMKISTYHKSMGDTVEMIQEGGFYDKVYLSKTFNLPCVRKIPQTPPPFRAFEIVKGGSGYAITEKNGKEEYVKSLDKNLENTIEKLCPDYSLYPQHNKAYGFLTRGCPNNCSFCIVSEKEGRKSKRVSELSDWHRGKKAIKLLDPNLLACKEREHILEELVDSGSWVDFTQGLDARLINDGVCSLLHKIKIKFVHFAFDLMKNEKEVTRGLKAFKKNTKLTEREMVCYVLTNFDTTHEEDWYRVQVVKELGYTPYVMIYQKGSHPRFITDLARWCNNKRLYRAMDFKDYVPRKDGKTCGELYDKIIY